MRGRRIFDSPEAVNPWGFGSTFNAISPRMDFLTSSVSLREGGCVGVKKA